MAQDPSHSVYFQRALLIAKDMLAKGIKERDLDNYQFEEKLHFHEEDDRPTHDYKGSNTKNLTSLFLWILKPLV